MSYVYLQHMDSEDEFDLEENFKRVSTLVVQEAKEATKLLPNHVYVISGQPEDDRNRWLAEASVETPKNKSLPAYK